MHEGTLVRELVAKVNAIAEAEGATTVSAVAVKVGDFSHVSADHLREHFAHEAAGTISERARLDVEPVGGLDNPLALEIVLDSIEIQQDDSAGPDELVGAALVPALDAPRNPPRDSRPTPRNEAHTPPAPRNEPAPQPAGANNE